MSVTDQLRQAIRANGSANRLAEDSGIAQSVISRFLSGERGLSSETVDRLAEYLGLELQPKRRK